MTQEAQIEKNFFTLNRGLNTEINELNFPDGFTTDEANYDLLVDGSRKRRKGLADESGAGAVLGVGTLRDAEAVQSFVWRNVGGDPSKKVIVTQVGTVLFIADDTDAAAVSTTWITSPIDISTFFSETTVTNANTDDKMLSFSQGRGDLFVSGPYIRPFYVRYDADNSRYESYAIQIKHRDFGDVDDGTSVQTEPTGTITPAHRYNLRNRGFKQTDMDQYFSDKSKHPMRASRWFMGYKRTYGSNVYERDGDRAWNSNKFDLEVFGNTSSAKGSIFLSPFDTRFGLGLEGDGPAIKGITTWTSVVNGSDWDITVTTSASHGFSEGDEFEIDGILSHYQSNTTEYANYWDFNGVHTAISGTTGSTLIFSVTPPADWASWIDQYKILGQVSDSVAIIKPDGQNNIDSFASIEFHAGRVFIAGMKNTDYADWIFFSQITEDRTKYGKCYQEADPTNEEFNALTSADGGTIVIPGMSEVVELISERNSLIVLAREGVWEISGGQRGVFTADGYSVRKLSDNGCTSPTGNMKIEGGMAYIGRGGIFIISPNEFTGLLEVTNAIAGSIQTLWNDIPTAEQERMQCFYDDAMKRGYFLYGADASSNLHNSLLIFDGRAGAFFKWTFNTSINSGLLAGFVLTDADIASDNKKMKFIYKSSSKNIQIADLDQTSFNDFDGSNGPLPFLVTGHDQTGDWQRRKQAPVIVVYSKRTETGYTSTGNGFDPVNESSTLMRAFWDWTDDAVSNKIGAQQQVYRHVRQFVPSGTSDVDGYPVVVTRNKVRGRGRALQLRFDGATDKDSHILGFTTNYKSTRKK